MSACRSCQQDLELFGLDIQPSDAMRFTCLTGLTSLDLSYCLQMGDLAAVAVACRLTKLRRLILDADRLENEALWPAVACLTGLEHLSFAYDAPQLTDAACTRCHP